MNSINVMMLSAGLGTRLRPYTETIPKPAIPFLGVPLACYPLSLFEGFKINNLVVNTHHLPEQVEALYRKINWPSKKLIFSRETGQILGSGGGVRQALPHLIGRNKFIFANADEVILPEHHFVMKDALDFHDYHKGIATIITIKHPEVGQKFGGVWVEDGPTGAGEPQHGTKVKFFSKKAVVGCHGLHFVGVMILSDKIKNYFFDDPAKEENILYDTLTKAMALGEEVHAFNINAEWFETGNPSDFLEAQKKCKQALAEKERPRWAQSLEGIINLNGGWPEIIK